jgi:hypothetical protein
MNAAAIMISNYEDYRRYRHLHHYHHENHHNESRSVIATSLAATILLLSSRHSIHPTLLLLLMKMLMMQAHSTMNPSTPTTVIDSNSDNRVMNPVTPDRSNPNTRNNMTLTKATGVVSQKANYVCCTNHCCYVSINTPMTSSNRCYQYIFIQV